MTDTWHVQPSPRKSQKHPVISELHSCSSSSRLGCPEQRSCVSSLRLPDGAQVPSSGTLVSGFWAGGHGVGGEQKFWKQTLLEGLAWRQTPANFLLKMPKSFVLQVIEFVAEKIRVLIVGHVPYLKVWSHAPRPPFWSESLRRTFQERRNWICTVTIITVLFPLP